MATALTAFLGSTNDTLVTTARQLVSTAPASESSVSAAKIGKTTGWVELASQGSTGVPGASEPSASGKGFIWDVTTLEGQQIVAGNWTPTVKLSVSAGSIVANIVVRAWVRNSGGVFTQIGSDLSLNSKTINTTASVFAFAATSLPAQNFGTGDKLYIDILINIATNSTGSNTATCSLFENGGANEQVVTPGYQLQSVTDALAGTITGVARATSGIALVKPLSFTLTGAARTSTGISLTKPLAATAKGAAMLANPALALSKALAGQALGRATISTAVSLAKALGSSASGVAKVTGAFASGAAQALAGSLSGRATATAVLSLAKPLGASLKGVATLISPLGNIKAMGASLSGIGRLSAPLSLLKGLAGSILGSGQGQLTSAVTPAPSPPTQTGLPRRVYADWLTAGLPLPRTDEPLSRGATDFLKSDNDPTVQQG